MSAKRHSRGGRAKEALDRISLRPRGRPRKADSEAQLGSRAAAYFDTFRFALPCLWDDLATAASDDDVVAAFDRADVRNYHELIRLAGLIRQVVHEKRFPNGLESRAKFLADSLAAGGTVAARTSRDSVGELRQKAERTGRIVRVEMHVWCSCGYEGESHRLACPKCKARIPANFLYLAASDDD